VNKKKILVTGAGGFIGGWLVDKLAKTEIYEVVAVDIKDFSEWLQINHLSKNIVLDLTIQKNCVEVTRGIDFVFNLAADMGGMGFIENNKSKCMLSVLINTHLLQACVQNYVKKYFFSSSACVYNASKQVLENNLGLKESDAYPAMPEDGYGWEKLFSERMCKNFEEDFGIEIRIARYHNVYGPIGTYKGGREKAPAAICRKIAEALINRSEEIEIWGDGNQTRSFTFVDDAVEGTLRLFDSNFNEPINIGSSELVSVNELVTMVENIASVKLKRKFLLGAPQGVRGRNSDNTLIKETLDWQPSITLRDGLIKTYEWIFEQVSNDFKKLR
jgi:GDP-D-mannose 3',5'-epimerase